MRSRAQMAAALALCAASSAWADGISGLVEGNYSHSSSTISDQSGFDQSSVADQIVQRYRLALDRAIYPQLRLTLGGTFEQFNAWSEAGGTSSDLRSRTASFFGNLAVGNPILSAAAGYSRRVQTAA